MWRHLFFDTHLSVILFGHCTKYIFIPMYDIFRLIQSCDMRCYFHESNSWCQYVFLREISRSSGTSLTGGNQFLRTTVHRISGKQWFSGPTAPKIIYARRSGRHTILRHLSINWDGAVGPANKNHVTTKLRPSLIYAGDFNGHNEYPGYAGNRHI